MPYLNSKRCAHIPIYKQVLSLVKMNENWMNVWLFSGCMSSMVDIIVWTNWMMYVHKFIFWEGENRMEMQDDMNT